MGIKETIVDEATLRNLPVGTIIRNHKGEYGVMDEQDGKRVIVRVSREFVEQIKREFGGSV